MDDQPPSPLTRPITTPLSSEPSSGLFSPLLDDEAGFLPQIAGDGSVGETTVYRPGAPVAVALLTAPVLFAVVGMWVAIASHRVPIWLPIALLLWLPFIALEWLLIKSVRITPDTISCGRPLRRWQQISFDEVERVEQRGLRLIVGGRSGAPLVFTPLLLNQGAELRRSLLLRLPLQTLWGRLRLEAQLLTDGGVGATRAESDISGVLTVRSRWLWPALGLGVTLALLGLGLLAALTLPGFWKLALGGLAVALAIGSGWVSLWTPQEIFFSEKGLIIHYLLLRRERVVFWEQVRAIEYIPGEFALLFGGVRRVMCIGPGALSVQHARLMRQFVSRYCPAHVRVSPLTFRAGNRI